MTGAWLRGHPVPQPHTKRIDESARACLLLLLRRCGTQQLFGLPFRPSIITGGPGRTRARYGLRLAPFCRPLAALAAKRCAGPLLLSRP